MEIGLGVGIPLLVLVLVAGGVYLWGKTTLTGYIVMGGFKHMWKHHSRKRKRNTANAEIAAILAPTSTQSPYNREHTQTRVRAAEKAVNDAEEAMHDAEEALKEAEKASKMARTVRHSNNTQGGNANMAPNQEQAEKDVTKATQAYITASKAKNTASTLLRKAQNNENQMPREGIRHGFHGEQKKEETYNTEEVFLRRDRKHR